MKKLLLILLFSSMGIFAQQSSWDWGTKILGATDTLTTRIDSVVNMISSGDSTFANIGLTAWVEGYVIADDTIEVSTDASFTNPVKVLPNTTSYPFLIPKSKIGDVSNLYIRRFSISGGTGTVNLIVRITGL